MIILRNIPLLLNVAIVLVLLVSGLANGSASFGVLLFLVVPPALSILTFAMVVPGRTFLILCCIGNIVASVLGSLTAILFFLMVSRAATFGMVVVLFLFYSLVAVYSSVAAFKQWKLTCERMLS